MQYRKSSEGLGWAKLEKINTDCILVNLKNIGLTFFKFISISSELILVRYLAVILPMEHSLNSRDHTSQR